MATRAWVGHAIIGDVDQEGVLSNTQRAIAIGASLIPLAYTLVTLRDLPDQVPAHFDISGNVTRWGSKYEGIAMPLVAIALVVFLVFAPRRWMNGDSSPKILFWTSIAISLTFTIIEVFITRLIRSHL